MIPRSLPTWVVASSPLTMATVAFECWVVYRSWGNEWGNQFPRQPFLSRMPWDSLFKWKINIFCIFEPKMGDIFLIPKMPSDHVSYCSDAKYLGLFNANLFRSHAFLGPNITGASFLATSKIFHFLSVLIFFFGTRNWTHELVLTRQALEPQS